VLLIAFLAAAVAGGEPSAEAAPAPVSSVAVRAKEVDPMVCYREQGTGTLISKRVCRPRSQIRRQREDARETGSKIQGGGTYYGGKPPN
jgi:hypothetical protein